MLERRELGEAGLAYIRERLAQGRTLSRLLLEGLNLAAGRAWAYLPPAMTDEQAVRFAEAGVTRLTTDAEPEVEVRPDGRWEVVQDLVEQLVVSRVADFLSNEDQGVAVWEDPLLQGAEDTWVKAHPDEPLLFMGDEVYYVVRHDMATLTTVADGLSVMEAWWGSPALLATLPAEALRPFLTPRSSISADDLHPLVEHCQFLFFEAYDREGFVCWSLDGAPVRSRTTAGGQSGGR